MLDPKILRDSPNSVKEMLRKRNSDFPLEDLLDLDQQRRTLIVSTQELRQQKNKLSEKVALKKKGNEDSSLELQQMKVLGQELDQNEATLASVQDKFSKLMLTLPNLLDSSVPEGKDETYNMEIRRIGTPRVFTKKPKDHVDICNELDLIDLERASKISGARFYFLKKDLVRLNLAIINFALDFISGQGHTLIQPPFMIRKKPMEGAVILGDFQDVIYKVEQEDLYLIGTSEHAIASMHMDEIIDGRKLPLRYAGTSPCFRKEAGAHGKDMKGIFRVHQFEKVEQFVFCKPDQSQAEHERMLGLCENFVQLLGIPYRVILLSSGDTGKISSKTYDIEAWMPGQSAYREIISCSNCLDYQSRGLSIRFRDKTNEETRFVHTLNSTLVATERMIVSIVENYQRDDGKVDIPPVLHKYMNGTTILTGLS